MFTSVCLSVWHPTERAYLPRTGPDQIRFLGIRTNALIRAAQGLHGILYAWWFETFFFDYAYLIPGGWGAILLAWRPLVCVAVPVYIQMLSSQLDQP
jgi:hypothetical protein